MGLYSIELSFSFFHFPLTMLMSEWNGEFNVRVCSCLHHLLLSHYRGHWRIDVIARLTFANGSPSKAIVLANGSGHSDAFGLFRSMWDSDDSETSLWSDDPCRLAYGPLSSQLNYLKQQLNKIIQYGWSKRSEVYKYVLSRDINIKFQDSLQVHVGKNELKTL